MKWTCQHITAIPLIIIVLVNIVITFFFCPPFPVQAVCTLWFVKNSVYRKCIAATAVTVAAVSSNRLSMTVGTF